MSKVQTIILGIAIAFYVVWRVNMIRAGYRKQRQRMGANPKPTDRVNTNTPLG